MALFRRGCRGDTLIDIRRESAMKECSGVTHGQRAECDRDDELSVGRAHKFVTYAAVR